MTTRATPRGGGSLREPAYPAADARRNGAGVAGNHRPAQLDDGISSCSAAEYRRMVVEKAAAAQRRRLSFRAPTRQAPCRGSAGPLAPPCHRECQASEEEVMAGDSSRARSARI
ncbi:MAG: hypothetical protein IPK78_19535 [Rhodospirillales bacterium]|nr:hypothetical protein [Rhodospirillales bacterium]